MSFSPTSATRLIALLGDPVAHSLSPVFQNAAFRAAGVDGVYIALRCASDHVPSLLRAVALSGGGGNVTIPHKETASRALDRRTDAVIRTGACNTYWSRDGEVWGDNTDVAGVREAMRALLGQPPAGARVLLLGAGGAARATLAALEQEGVSEVVILNRTAERARSLEGHFGDAPLRIRVAASPESVADERFDLAINSTSIGLRDADPLPLPLEGGPRLGAALDLVYTRSGTAWVRELRRREVPAADGLEMLLRQGAASFERWWERNAPLEAMRSSLPQADSS